MSENLEASGKNEDFRLKITELSLLQFGDEKSNEEEGSCLEKNSNSHCAKKAKLEVSDDSVSVIVTWRDGDSALSRDALVLVTEPIDSALHLRWKAKVNISKSIPSTISSVSENVTANFSSSSTRKRIIAFWRIELFLDCMFTNQLIRLGETEAADFIDDNFTTFHFKVSQLDLSKIRRSVLMNVGFLRLTCITTLSDSRKGRELEIGQLNTVVQFREECKKLVRTTYSPFD